MNRATVSLASLAAAGASLLGVASLAGPAVAKSTCVLHPKSKRVPYLVSPCNGMTVKRGQDITFRVHDANPNAAHYAPVLNLQTTHTLKDGHLTNNVDGNGIFSQLTKVKSGTWHLVAKHQIYPSWWDNHKGTYYVQVLQIDIRSPDHSYYYSPIVTIHVR